MEQSAVGDYALVDRGQGFCPLLRHVGPGSSQIPFLFFACITGIYPLQTLFPTPLTSQFLAPLGPWKVLAGIQKGLFLFLSASSIYLMMGVAPHTFVCLAYPTGFPRFHVQSGSGSRAPGPILSSSQACGNFLPLLISFFF